MIARWGVLLMIGTVALGPQLAAQQLRLGGGPPRAELERRIQERFADLVSAQLGLDAEQARNLGQVVLRFQTERQALLRREGELRRRHRMEAAAAGRGGGPLGGAASGRRAELMEDAEAREVLSEMRSLRTAETDLYVREQERLLELLTPGQLVRYYLLREQLADAIGRLRGGGGPGGGLGGRGGRGDVPSMLRRPDGAGGAGLWWRGGGNPRTFPPPSGGRGGGAGG